MGNYKDEVKGIFGIRKIVFTIILVFVVFFMTAIGVKEINKVYKQECLSSLKGAAQTTDSRISDWIEFSQNSLHGMSNSIGLSKNLKDKKNLALIKSLKSSVFCEPVRLFFPDGTAYTEHGYLKNVDKVLDYKQMFSENPKLTTVQSDLVNLDKKVIYHNVPILREGKVKAMLSAVISPEYFIKRIRLENYGGDMEVQMFDLRTQKVFVDTAHSDIVDVSDYSTRKDKDGNSINEWIEKVKNGKEANCTVISKKTGKPVCMYAIPSNYPEWMLILLVDEQVAFGVVDRIKHACVFFVVVEVVLFLAYLVWIVFNTKKQMVFEMHRSRMDMIVRNRLKQSRVLASLSDNFVDVFYVDPYTGAYSMYSKDENTRYQEFSRRFDNGTNFIDVMNSDEITQIHKDDINQCNMIFSKENFMEIIDSEDRQVVDLRFCVGDGYIWMRYILVPYINDDTTSSIVVGVEDITEEKLHQVRLEDSKNRAENENKAKTNFLFNMSHDIRTPMNAIKGFSELAWKHIDDKEKVKDCLCKVNNSSEQLMKLINDVLDMSRIESGKVEMARESINLQSICVACCSIIEGQLIGREIEFDKVIPGGESTRLIGDELHLRQILINILGNAVKFTNDGGKISFIVKSYETSEDTIKFCFTIKDTGIGMSKGYLEHIFEPFSQENDSARTNYKGTGLGMAITKQFVELLNGEIEVNSVYGEGSTFNVRIPFEIDKNDVIKRKKKKIEEIDLSKSTILLVEDNDLNIELGQDILCDEGATVICARNGKEALEIFEKSEPYSIDVILMDIRMPVMDGYQATMHIRKLKREDAVKVPIIAVSANAFEEDVLKSIRNGMNGHVAKPINVDELKKLLKTFI